ncbi:Down syndrome cell adhesion molecule-like protein 1 [Eurytemora carolleeae]|uniref:Down syndrome cell adhesion molecule-like protein 1 n=1 Tax=Eurytemora carolleeae TaxID=1294199 RepID=UPI000C79090E|nr:Down syndrome cell adhesion molecule-like protein 1 [Eurytemora carolleeae]|eukprot:XP_023335863.1 Down syndrome cell adhesion molecule-like protein 1 [Eurytemora affinis]
MDRITCQVENEFGEDRIHYSIDIVAAPNAPTIRLESSDLDSITISWHLPHNGGALIQGYFLNYKMVGSDWTEISLDYDLLTFTLQDLPCGSTFLVNLVAHNIAGRSKPSATLTSSTQGSVPGIPDLNSMLSVNSTSILLHLYGWPDGGCTVHYFVVQYRELTQDTWRVLSSNIRSAEEDVLISDLSPSTRYILQLTAQNTAGNRLVTGHVATLTLTGHTLPPWSSTTQQTITDQVDGSLAIPIILSIIIVSTALLLSIYCFKRRQFVSYPGYTPTLNQYSVKSLSDIPTGNVHVYTPLTIQRIRKAESNQRIDASTGTPYNAVPYAVYRSPNVQPPDKDVDYSSPLFQTFGRTLDSTKSLIRTPDSSQTFIRTPDSIQSFVRTPDTTKTLLSRPNSVHLAGFNLNNIRGPTDPISLEISSISRQLHPTHTQTLGRNTQRFSMCSETDSTEENTLNKFATLRRSRRYSSREASDLLSDSSTESAVEIIKQQARLTRRNKRSKQARRCRSQSSLEDMDNQISTFTRLSTDSRELTEPECDRDITEFTTLQAQIRNQLEKIREQDIVKPAGISHQNSWNTANQRHLEEKFVIKV